MELFHFVFHPDFEMNLTFTADLDRPSQSQTTQVKTQHSSDSINLVVRNFLTLEVAHSRLDQIPYLVGGY